MIHVIHASLVNKIARCEATFCNNNFFTDMMKINIVSQKLIKPCIPTPLNLRRYRISFLDESIPPVNIAIILYYGSKPENISQLEESLARILPQFYPLAGRYIKNDRLVDCSDQGAQFVRAEVDLMLCDVVCKTTTSEQLSALLPRQFYQIDEAVTTPLLSIQITDFKCGALAIAISVTHRIFDAHSLGTFITAWRDASNAACEIRITPTFDGPSLFISSEVREPPGASPHCAFKRFLFKKQAIASLRSKLKQNDKGETTSRVRVVTALISNALMRVDRTNCGYSRACLIIQAFNIRGRLVPPLPKHSCGNFVLASSTRRIAANETEDIGIQDLVDVIGEALEKTIHDCSGILVPGADRGKKIDDCMEGIAAKFAGSETNSLHFSDWSKFGFYEADFGWGKPVWASIGPVPHPNMTILMDDREGGGIEAWLHLNETDTAYFEQDEDIKLFAIQDGT